MERNFYFFIYQCILLFSVFFYLVWVVRILENFDSPSSPCLDHFLLSSTISVASIQSYRPTIKNRIFHKFMILHPMVLFSRYRLNTANDLAQFLVQRLCLKCPRIYRPGMIDIILLFFFFWYHFTLSFLKFYFFVSIYKVFGRRTRLHSLVLYSQYGFDLPFYKKQFTLEKLNSCPHSILFVPRASAWLVTACFYSISGHRDCIWVQQCLLGFLL